MSLPPIVASILQSGAPTLLAAIALPPPFNLIASAVVSGVLAQFLPEGDAPAQSKPGGGAALSPAQVTQVVEAHAKDPDFLPKLREAEAKLKEYEAANDLKFAELQVEDKNRAGRFQIATGTAAALLRWGMGIVVVAILAMAAVVAGSIMLVSGGWELRPDKAQLAVGVFGLIGTVVGYISGYGAQIIGFYYGSSQGSKEKSESLDAVLQQQGQQLGRAAAAATTAAATSAATTATTVSAAAASAAQTAVATIAARAGGSAAEPVQWKQGPFGGVRWRLTQAGILVEGETAPARTVGEPATVRRIWRDFGDIIKGVCAPLGVPAEVVVTTIAVESRGVIAATLHEPDGRTSVGLMQTLTETASQVMGRNITAADLEKPEISIEAGTRYIASQRAKTQYDPILVAAAYNAGGIDPPRPGDDNPWKLRCTGDHLTRTKLYYNDAVAVAKEDGWFK